MNNGRQDLNADSTASRKSRPNVATVAAGLIALAVAAAAVLDERAGRMPSGGPAESAAAPVATAPTEARTLLSNTTQSTGAARPHFERTDEPVYTNPENPYGG